MVESRHAAFFRSLKLFTQGPVWRVAGVLSGLVTAVGLIQALGDQSLDTLWKWLFLASLALVAASFYSFHRHRIDAEAEKEMLPRKIDDLHRHGIGLVGELAPVAEPETVEGGRVWTLALGDAPSEWWEKALTFEQQIRDLFIERYPALLSDYAGGANEFLRKERETRRRRAEEIEADPKLDKRSDREKVLDFAKQMQSGPEEHVKASLHGLVAARHRAGLSGAGGAASK